MPSSSSALAEAVEVTRTSSTRGVEIRWNAPLGSRSKARTRAPRATMRGCDRRRRRSHRRTVPPGRTASPATTSSRRTGTCAGATLIEPELRRETRLLLRSTASSFRVTLLGPNLRRAAQRTDRNGLALDSSVGAQCGRNEQPALRVARGFVGVREKDAARNGGSARPFNGAASSRSQNASQVDEGTARGTVGLARSSDEAWRPGARESARARRDDPCRQGHARPDR
jgi:hypothetical protein